MSEMAKRIAAKVTSAPGRNALNITGGQNGQAATKPGRKTVVSSALGSMNSGKMDNAQLVPGVKAPRRVKTQAFAKSSLIPDNRTGKKSVAPSNPANKSQANKAGAAD